MIWEKLTGEQPGPSAVSGENSRSGREKPDRSSSFGRARLCGGCGGGDGEDYVKI